MIIINYHEMMVRKYINRIRESGSKGYLSLTIAKSNGQEHSLQYIQKQFVRLVTILELN